MCEYVRLTIEDLRRRRQQCDDAIRFLLELEGMPMPPVVQMPSELIKPGPVPEQDAPASGRRRQRRKIDSKKKGSAFRGVMPIVSRRDGSVKYRATYWDSAAKKNMTLGTWADELEAALAVARRLEDAPEVKRIKELIKQRDSKLAQPPEKTKPPAEPKKDRRSKLTHYKGVKLGKPRADGTPRYEVNVYIDGRVKYLGIFDMEEEAAAVAAEARGEKAEALRLRELVEQKNADEQEQRENNPDRTASWRQTRTEADPSDEDRTDKTPQIWECKNCFKQYIQAISPSKCRECSHTEFRAIV